VCVDVYHDPQTSLGLRTLENENKKIFFVDSSSYGRHVWDAWEWGLKMGILSTNLSTLKKVFFEGLRNGNVSK
jgi:hypothetical protein